MKKTIVCDMDGVLAESRKKASTKMLELIDQLQKNYNFVIITGGNYKLIKYQILDELENNEIHCLSQQGLVYHYKDKLIHEEELAEIYKLKIINEVSLILNKMNHKPYNWDVIEDRGSQITLSLLGRTAPLRLKKEYDPEKFIRSLLKRQLQSNLPNIEIKIGGTTSLDFTIEGHDKGYGLTKFLKLRKIKQSDCVFFGDNLQEEGNDYPVKAVIQNCIAVKTPQETYEKIKELISSP